MKKKIYGIFLVSVVVLFLFSCLFFVFMFPKRYENYIVEYSNEFGLEKELVYAVIKVESDFKKDAVSKSGALGLMQILPSTAKWIAKELGEDYLDEKMFEPKTNIKFGCFYLNYLFEKFDSLEVVICAYNAGEGNVLEWIENGRLEKDKIDFEETRNYLKKVEKYYRVYKSKLINV